jgi:hypothetical protein
VAGGIGYHRTMPKSAAAVSAATTTGALQPGWLPPGVLYREPHQRALDDSSGPSPDGRPTFHQSVAAAFAAAPVGRILAAAPPGRTPRYVGVPGRDVEVVPFDLSAAPVRSLARDAAGCLFDGLIERVDQPAALLSWAYEHLPAGGVLVITARDVRRFSARKLTKAASGDRKYLFAGESLAALLFREGFVAPRFHIEGGELIAVARRGQLKPPPQRRLRLSVVMPVYNERSGFQKTMERLLDKEIPEVDIDVIVVESNSTDGTREDVLAYRDDPRVEVILEEKPSGKGHAVRRGLEVAAGDFILIQDADLEYDIDDYDALLEPLSRYEVGFVLGMRTSADGSWGVRKFGQNTMTSHVMNVGHLVFLALFNLVYRQKLRDPFTMYKVFRKDCVHGLTFECDRFDFDWELTGKLIRAGYHPIELPVSYHSRSFHEGKKVSFFRDPLTWIRACFRYRFSPLYVDD